MHPRCAQDTSSRWYETCGLIKNISWNTQWEKTNQGKKEYTQSTFLDDDQLEDKAAWMVISVYWLLKLRPRQLSYFHDILRMLPTALLSLLVLARVMGPLGMAKASSSSAGLSSSLHLKGNISCNSATVLFWISVGLKLRNSSKNLSALFLISSCAVTNAQKGILFLWWHSLLLRPLQHCEKRYCYDHLLVTSGALTFASKSFLQ